MTASGEASASGGPTALGGRTVVVTRPAGRAASLVDPLKERGARVLHLPALEILPPQDPDALRQAARDLVHFDWVVFTSRTGVTAFRRALEEVGAGGPAAGTPRVAAVGSSTGDALRAAGWKVALEPDAFTGEGLVDAFRALAPPAGTRVLLPVAEAARDTVPDGLRGLGCGVRRVVAYRSGTPDEARVAAVRETLEAGELDLLTFTSPSTAEGFLEMLGPGALDVPAAVIGPVTGEAARGMGYRVVAVAEPHTAEGLVEAAVGWLGSAGGRDG